MATTTTVNRTLLVAVAMQTVRSSARCRGGSVHEDALSPKSKLLKTAQPFDVEHGYSRRTLSPPTSGNGTFRILVAETPTCIVVLHNASMLEFALRIGFDHTPVSKLEFGDADDHLKVLAALGAASARANCVSCGPPALQEPMHWSEAALCRVCDECLLPLRIESDDEAQLVEAGRHGALKHGDLQLPAAVAHRARRARGDRGHQSLCPRGYGCFRSTPQRLQRLPRQSGYEGRRAGRNRVACGVLAAAQRSREAEGLGGTEDHVTTCRNG
mmetsp:Transcript_72960/g.235975  ORF Transcript_72960/g.235975 Transcript_72960/m.235975 type:complete len:271 (+) Transcript_72960:105-917(+)